MDGNLEFRVLMLYLLAMYLVPVVRWRKTRYGVAVVGIRGERQNRARWVATGIFLLPLANYLIDGPWPWYPELGLPAGVRWCSTAPAALALLLLIAACRYTEGGGQSEPDWHIDEGPYRHIRHPQLLASSIFFLSLAVLSSNGVVLIATIFGILMLRLVVAPAVEEDLEDQFGEPYVDYLERTGGFCVQLAPIPKAEYTVPRRFGLFSVVALTTIFAVLFAALNYMRAQPVVYLFVATEIAAICLVQIFFESAARRGSALIGGLLLPIWFGIYFANDLHEIKSVLILIILFGFMTLFGAFLGYCIGGLAAGFFLVMDMVEPFLPGYKPPEELPSPDKRP